MSVEIIPNKEFPDEWMIKVPDIEPSYIVAHEEVDTGEGRFLQIGEFSDELGNESVVFLLPGSGNVMVRTQFLEGEMTLRQTYMTFEEFKGLRGK